MNRFWRTTRPPSDEPPATPPRATPRVLAIGASTGGTVALDAILRRLPETAPGMIVTQHMPPSFTSSFAARLNHIGRLEVREAVDGDRVVPGLVLIAPGDRHLLLRRDGPSYYVRVKNGPPVNNYRPSVDVMFDSVAEWAGDRGIGVILTGMGCDGARGLKAMRAAGAHTIAQNALSSVVFGMPKVAIEMGAAVEVCGLDDVPSAILRTARRPLTTETAVLNVG